MVGSILKMSFKELLEVDFADASLWEGYILSELRHGEDNRVFVCFKLFLIVYFLKFIRVISKRYVQKTMIVIIAE